MPVGPSRCLPFSVVPVPVCSGGTVQLLPGAKGGAVGQAHARRVSDLAQNPITLPPSLNLSPSFSASCARPDVVTGSPWELEAENASATRGG